MAGAFRSTRTRNKEALNGATRSLHRSELCRPDGRGGVGAAEPAIVQGCPTRRRRHGANDAETSHGRTRSFEPFGPELVRPYAVDGLGRAEPAVVPRRADPGGLPGARRGERRRATGLAVVAYARRCATSVGARPECAEPRDRRPGQLARPLPAAVCA